MAAFVLSSSCRHPYGQTTTDATRTTKRLLTQSVRRRSWLASCAGFASPDSPPDE